MKILITGLCGFIGAHIVEHILKETDWDIVGIDKLTYASNGFERIKDIEAYDDKRFKLFTADFTKPIDECLAEEIGEIDYILHMGAETHVDTSITEPGRFVQANILGAYEMLEYARKLKGLKKFIYFSTDEVYGPAPQGYEYKEGDRYNPGNPYAATKAGAECLCEAYANTYKLPIVITNTMNVFGERQHPEKFIPLVINKVLAGEKVSIHANKEKTKAGSRFWIHGRNVASAILFIINNTTETLDTHDATKGKFNIVGDKEVDNLEMAQFISMVLGKELKYEMVDFHSSRPGHDLRYGLNGDKMKNLGWKPKRAFEESLKRTIEWTIKNDKWLKLNKA